ncbi:MAG: DUF4129 domain-containing protein [Anaerolineae bacterium]|nr:DUF4129 domain-containing protein [Anaerolineae bacterium]
MQDRNKYRVLVVASAAVVATVILAAGISKMALSPGLPWETWMKLLFGDMGIQRPTGVPSLLSGQGLVDALRVMFLGLMLLIPVLIVAMIFSPDLRKKALRMFVQALFFVLVALVLFRSGALDSFGMMTQNMQELFSDQLPEGEITPLEDMPEFTPAPPAWAIWVASFVLAALFFALVAGVGWSFWRNRIERYRPLRKLAKDAQEALDALESGADLRNTVIRCYHDMSEAVKAQRGIQRERAMTPREFESRLMAQGMPETAVRQLTRLFESVRYGALEPGDRDVDQAVTCLSAIVEACRGL